MSCSRQFARSLARKNQPRRVLSFGSGRAALSVLPRTVASFSTTANTSSSSTSTTTTNNDNSLNGRNTTLPPSNPSSSTTTTASMMTDPREALFQAALVQVPEHGWTRHAIVAAVPHAFPGASLSMAGQITPSDMVAYCMDEWNTRLYKELTTNKEPLSIAQALQRRLEYQVPLVQCGRWQQAMAMGLTTPEKTYHQLQTLIQTVLSHAQQPSTTSSSSSHSTTSQLTLGGIYVATELHLLADTSTNYQDTWQFLQQRVHEWETGSHTTTSLLSSLPSTAMPFANPAMASTVASALASGVASVLFHNNAASTISTINRSTSSSSSSSIDGTDPRHYQTPTAPAPQSENSAKQS